MTSPGSSIGFIGQGYVGKNIADDIESRGYATTRYSLEEPYIGNKEKIADCDIVFVAVPTPTTPEGFSAAVVKEALALVGPGKTAVIKSTILPGTTKELQQAYPDRVVLFSPEFLREATAAEDAAHPYSIIVGMPVEDDAHRRAADAVIAVLPKVPGTFVCNSTEAELVKYAQNASGYIQIVFFNLLYDLTKALGVDWEPIRNALSADPNIPVRFTNPVHKGGRGAGGHCLIKDFAALVALYESTSPEDKEGIRMLQAIADKNVDLLKGSGKDLDLLSGVYGTDIAS